MATSIDRSHPLLTSIRRQQQISSGATRSSWLLGLMPLHLSPLPLVRSNQCHARLPHKVPSHCISVKGEKSPSSLKRAISTRSNSSWSVRSRISRHKSPSANSRSHDTNNGRRRTTIQCRSGHDTKSWTADSLIFRCVSQSMKGSPV